MAKPKPKRAFLRKKNKLSESQEIEFLQKWIEFGKPESGSNPLSTSPPSKDYPVGQLGEHLFSQYSGCTRFDQLPISKKTKDGLGTKYTVMTEIQRASLPHSLCGRDILGGAKTGSGKTLAFIIPVLENLYRAKWGSEDGVGCIIISPTRELAAQLFDELKAIGKYHSFSAGLLIGGRKDINTEKDRVNDLNILVCTPGRLLQHMDETPNFDCSQLQILILDEADRVLDGGFEKALNAIISQLPKRRQTFLFSATQTKSVKDLARLSLKDPEYLSVHAESVTATPEKLQQTAMVVSLEQKLDMLWSFIKSHLRSKILVFLSSCKQVKYVYEAFKKIRPGIPLKCLHGRMKLEQRMGICSQFRKNISVLFSTDVASRGLDIPEVDWVVQMDCPEDVAAYLHRVGRTARFTSSGKSVLFLMPSEMEMMTKLQASKIPIRIIKANTERIQPVSGLLASLLVKYPDMQHLAQRAFVTYLRSIYLQRDKEIFDVMKLPIEDFSASLGLPIAPKVRFLNLKMKEKKPIVKSPKEIENMVDVFEKKKEQTMLKSKESEENIVFEKKIFSGSEMAKESLKSKTIEELEDSILVEKKSKVDESNENTAAVTRIVKKRKLKINVHRPAGTRVVFDEEGNTLPPLAALADTEIRDGILEHDKVKERYELLKKEMKEQDKQDKQLQKRWLREKRIKEKTKMKRERDDDENEDDSTSDGDTLEGGNAKRCKIYFDSDDDEDERKLNTKDFADTISIADQETLALKLLNSMHS